MLSFKIETFSSKKFQEIQLKLFFLVDVSIDNFLIRSHSSCTLKCISVVIRMRMSSEKISNLSMYKIIHESGGYLTRETIAASQYVYSNLLTTKEDERNELFAGLRGGLGLLDWELRKSL